LRPLTRARPKVLCPVDNVPLVDLALDRMARVTADIAVNVHAGREQMEAHLGGRVHLSFEEPAALGTAGALGHLRDWIDGRAVLVVNGDAWSQADLRALVEGWDGERVRLLLAGGGPLGPRSDPVGSLLPWSLVRELAAEPSGLYEALWFPESTAGRIDIVGYDGPFVDCGTPRSYLDANLTASGGRSVIGEGAIVEGTVERSVIWPGAVVHRAEHLVDAIRADDRTTVLVR
jgi:NDP-sugar pyrophosphorylase family protein